MSRKGITIFVFLLIAAVGAFAYYCHQLVERETAGQQSAPAAQARRQNGERLLSFNATAGHVALK
jgi:hypothetical protein